MKFDRASGILLHPTSLPGPFGIGDIGSSALKWIDFLDQAGCRLWQILPLGPTGYGDSPYQCFSAFAGNPYLISPQLLLEDGLVSEADLEEGRSLPQSSVDYGSLISWKLRLLDRAYENFIRTAQGVVQRELAQFREENRLWLDDFALFMAIKENHGGAPWASWEPALRDRDADALRDAGEKLSLSIERQVFRQFLFFRQWFKVKEYAKEKEILLIGDIPIFVAHDSSDVWSHPELFYMDESGDPTVVAGVPPDYFSETGQLWGNPLYDWEVHKQNNYSWWLNRFRAVLSQVDIVRLDHFRGFAGYWEIPAGMPTAEVGRWVDGPGADFFKAVRDSLGELPIIAEDLGVITDDVVELREKFELPGMKILQFAFAGRPSDEFLPHNYPQNCVVYTGTHDNDTVRGWYERVEEEERTFYRRYMARDGHNVSWDLIRGVWSSVAVFGLAPMQDFLSLGNEARMNYPGNPRGNWSWRMSETAMNESLAMRIHEINYLYSRLKTPEPEEAEEAPDAAQEMSEA